MALYQKVNYDLFLDQIKGLIGITNLSSADESFLRSSCNISVRKAYQRYPWPDFTIIGEPVVFPAGNPGNVVTHVDPNWIPGQLRLIHNADVVFRVHKEDPKTTRFPTEHTFASELNALQSPSIRIISPTSLEFQTVYISYRKDLKQIIEEPNLGIATYSSAQFGNGANDNPNLPEVFYDFLVHETYALFLKSDGQTQKALVEQQLAEQTLTHEIDKIITQGRQFRHDILQYRPPSQFNRHNIQAGNQPVVQVPGQPVNVQ